MTGHNPALAGFYVMLTSMSLIFAACGDDGENEDTLFSGFSLIVILIIVALIARHYIKKNK